MASRTAHSSLESAPADAGFSLTELLVAVIVGGLVLAMLGAFLVSSMQADRQVRDLNDASARGELALDTLRTSLQSAAPPIAVAAGMQAGDLIVRAAVAGTGTGELAWDCIAFYYDAAAAELRTMREPGSPGVPGARVATPDVATLATWTAVASGILPPATGAVFSLGDRDPGPGYEADSGALDVRFRVDAGDLGQPAYEASIVSRSLSPGGVACAP